MGHKVADFVFLPNISFYYCSYGFRMYLRVIGQPYVESLYNQSDLPSNPPMGQAGVIKIADFDILQYISLITAFTALECMRGIGKPYVESLASGSDLPPDPPPLPPWIKLGS